MIKVRNGYGKDAAVLTIVADSAAALDWAKANGYGPLSIQMRSDEYRVARIFDPMADLDVR